MNVYYFKTIQPHHHYSLNRLMKITHRWVFTGVVSPYSSDYLVMHTNKKTEAIFHTDKELELVKRRLTDENLEWRLYNAKTNEECI